MKEGPYVQMAAFCDYVLEDKTGALSVIRIVDRLIIPTTGPDVPSVIPKTTFNFTLIIMLKSGRARGRHELKVVPELPNGQTLPAFVQSVFFEGEDRGQNIIIKGPFPLEMEGLYWFHVKLGEDLLTKVPFRIVYTYTTVATQP